MLLLFLLSIFDDLFRIKQLQNSRGLYLFRVSWDSLGQASIWHNLPDGQVEISSGKLTFGITCPTGKLMKKLVLTPGIGVARIFDCGGGQTTNHTQWRHQKLRIRNFLWGAKISKKGRSEAVAWCWYVTTHSFKGEGLNLKLKCKNM